MQVTKITGFIGAQITGVDLKDSITPAISSALKGALGAHHMIVLPGQHLDIEAQKRLTSIFGNLMQLPYVQPLAGDPQVIAVLKEAHEQNTGVFGGEWHTDFSFLRSPPAGSVLNAIEIPEVGGDTVWSDQTAAYESLPPDLRSFVDCRMAVHIGKPYGVRHAPPGLDRANSSIKMTRGEPQADKEVQHPAVITDPATGRRALFVNPVYVVRFADMTEKESAPYLAALYKHATRPDFSCRLKWQAGDVAIWDNRMTLHYATNDYDGMRRLLYRTTFAGPAPC